MDTITASRSSMPKSLPHNVAAMLRDCIRSGHYLMGDMLPSERALAEEFNVARGTVRVAITELTTEGLLDRRPHCRAVVRSPQMLRSASNALSAETRLNASRFLALVMWRGGAGDVVPAAQQRVFSGMNEALRGTGYHGIFIDVGHNLGTHRRTSDGERDHLNYALNNGFGGIVFHPQDCSSRSELVQEISRRMPLVLLNHKMPGVRADFVGSGNREASYEATWHLINQGHERIAFVTSGEYNTEQERLQGYRLALSEAFPLGDYEMILTPPIVYGKAWPMLDAIGSLPGAERPTAAVCAGGREADRITGYLAALNIRVPDDVSLIGFDNIPQTLVNGVGLTTLVQSYEEIGRSAAKLLLRRRQDPSAALTHIELPTRLIERRSVKRLCGDGIRAGSI